MNEIILGGLLVFFISMTSGLLYDRFYTHKKRIEAHKHRINQLTHAKACHLKRAQERYDWLICAWRLKKSYWYIREHYPEVYRDSWRWRDYPKEFHQDLWDKAYEQTKWELPSR